MHATSDDRRSALGSSLRVVTWVALPLLMALYYLVLVSPLHPSVKLVPLELVYCTPVLLTAVLSYRAYRLSDGVERHFWASLSGANVILLACEVLLVVWVFAIDPAGPPRVSWPFHILHGFAAVLFVIPLVAMSRFGRSTTATKVRWALDASAALIILGVALTELYVRPVMSAAGATLPEMLLGTAYPLFGLVMLLGTLGNIVGFKIDRWRAWDRLFAVSLTIYACAITLWPLWFTTAVGGSRNYERGVLDLVQFSGHWLLMAAAVYRVTEASGWRVRPLPPIAATRRWVSLSLPATAIVAVPVVLWLAVSPRATDGWFAVYTSATTALTALVLARSAAMSLEFGVLFNRSVTDPLTGAYNHRFFHDYLAEQIDRATRYEEPLAVLFFNVDDFAGFNERFGHLAGDSLLTGVVAIMQSACRDACIVARLGGDRFAIVAPEMGPTAAALLASRLLDVVSIEGGAGPGTARMSAGIACYPDHGSSAEDLIRRADGALLHSKDSGKGKVTVFDPKRVSDLTVRDRIDRLQHQSRLASVHALAAAADARHPSADDHARAVARVSGAIAREMGTGEETARRIELGALLHEVGRIALPEPAEATRGLTHAEIEERHTVLGQQILITAGLADLAPMARSHHERWDGSGYPDGLAGTEIPVEARVLAVASRFCALTSGHGPEGTSRPLQALREIEVEAGRRFDPDVVVALSRVVGQAEATSCA